MALTKKHYWLVAISVLVLALVVYQWLGTATIAVTSEPPGAVVRIDGRQRGITPVARIELGVGGHRLEVVHSHFATHAEGLDLTLGTHLEKHVQFKVGKGTFQLLSNPRGAWVEIDGQRLTNKTPTQMQLVSGPHEIAMGREERHIVKRLVTINDDEVKEVNFNLNIDPHGTLTFTTSPRDARVEFIGEEIEYTPQMRVQIGEYAIRVSQPGWVPQEFRVGIIYGNNFKDIVLEREYGQLDVTASPANAELRVSYRDGGREYRKEYVRGMRVPVGRVEVRARGVGYRTGFKSFHLSGGGGAIRFNLQKMDVTPGNVLTDPLKVGGTAPAMVVIPAGSFSMGDSAGPPSEQPVRTVTLTQPFAVSKTEITIGEYQRFSQATARAFSPKLDISQLDVPVAHVSHDDAQAYASWLSAQTGEKYRLLSEAEWEYVARAGRGDSHYSFGNDPLALCRYGNVADLTARQSFRDWEVVKCTDGMIRPGAVGSYEANPFGLYDIYGNVSEWVADCGMPSYASAPNDGASDREGGSCRTHGVRGGSWDSTSIELRSSYRNTAHTGNDDRGIRILREL